METIEERVKQGAIWLDQRYPGWELLIDLGTLDMSDCLECILGQIYGDFFEAASSQHLGVEREVNFGFDSDWKASSDSQYEELGKAWTELIKDRLNVGIQL